VTGVDFEESGKRRVLKQQRTAIGCLQVRKTRLSLVRTLICAQQQTTGQRFCLCARSHPDVIKISFRRGFWREGPRRRRKAKKNDHGQPMWMNLHMGGTRLTLRRDSRS